MQIRDMPCHRDSTLQMLQDLILRYVDVLHTDICSNLLSNLVFNLAIRIHTRLADDIQHCFGHLKDWNFPKFSNLRGYPDDIRRFGVTDNHTSAVGERLNKHIKAAAQFTNFNPRTLQQQVESAFLSKLYGISC